MQPAAAQFGALHDAVKAHVALIGLAVQQLVLVDGHAGVEHQYADAPLRQQAQPHGDVPMCEAWACRTTLFRCLLRQLQRDRSGFTQGRRWNWPWRPGRRPAG